MEKRNKKLVIICFIGMLLSLVLIIGTIWYAKENLDTTVISMNSNENNIDSGDTPPDMPDGEMTDSSEVPAKPDGENEGSDDSSEAPDSSEIPDKPEGDIGESSSDVPEKPEGSEENVSDAQAVATSNTTLTLTYIIIIVGGTLIFVMSILTLFMSRVGKRKIFTNSDKILIYFLTVIVLTSALSVVITYLTNNYFLNSSVENVSENEMYASGVYEVDGIEDEVTDEEIESTNEDESVILVKNGGVLTISDSIISKTSGDSTSIENSEFYGINAGVLVQEGSSMTITNASISTSATGSNAVFATGEDAEIYITDSEITTTGSSSARGLDATYGGYIEADNVTVTTEGGSCATIATDKGEGTVIVKNSTLKTAGSGSPLIYSTGDITLESSTGEATGSQITVIEGKNSATITDSVLSASATGNRGDVDKAGIMIYQSMSGDADEGTGTFNATNSTFTIEEDSDDYETAPMFFVTNTTAIINLENSEFSYGSNTLLKIEGTSEWGTEGSNGGDVTLNAKKQELTGNIEVDDISSLKLNLENSNYTGVINASNSAQSIIVTLDENSTLTLTGNSYITDIEDDDTSYSNIISNGYIIYYDSDNSSLNGKTISLSDGGKLMPI